MEAEAITITTPPAIHVGPIINSASNETISIVIPLSAQLAAVDTRVTDQGKDCNEPEPGLSSFEVKIEPRNSLVQKTTISSIIQKADKTKGCPFPTCSRYGRAFSRAHDLKRHIARHETRKERLCDPPTSSDVRTCIHCGESFLNDAVLQRHMSIHMTPSTNDETVNNETRIYPCHLCKKKYTQFAKLKVHVATHDKKCLGNLCALCGIKCETEELLQNHMMEHNNTTILDVKEELQPNHLLTKVKVEDDNDDFMLEEMLLLKKNPRLSTPGTSEIDSSGKIRCDYCSKTFKTKWTLSSHVAAHEGRYQFGCSRCGKKFVRKSHYDGHVRSHEAARPYVCDQCGKTFKEIKHRREHTKRKHPSNHNAIQNLLDSISACVAEESMEQAKFTLLMPMNFTA